MPPFIGNKTRFVAAILLLAGCGGSPEGIAPGSILLARHPERLVELILPPSSPAEPPAEWVSFQDDLAFSRTGNGIDEYVVRHPFHYVEYGHNTLIAPPHFALRTPRDQTWTYSGNGNKPMSWAVTRLHLKVRVRQGTQPPDLAEWRVKYPIAGSESARMNLDASGLKPVEFALTQMRAAGGKRFGLFLPAPGTATFEITLPADPELSFRVGILRPQIDTGKRSDGATLHVEILKDGRVVRERICHLVRVGKRTHVQMKLAEYAGQTVKIRFRTEPGESSLLDHVFLTEPMVYTPSYSPKRLVLLFADTLRPDHLGAYGYARPTSPAIDQIARDGTIYDEIRSISPWTLPAARAALTGMQPEDWSHAKRLQTILAENGWHTSAFVSNAFLSAEFGMGEEWGLYRYRLLASAKETVDQALAEFARNPLSNSAILVHFMEPHLPYQETEDYRTLWAGTPPKAFADGVSLLDIGRMKDLNPKRKKRFATYLKARYDQNIRMMDDQIGRLMDRLPRDATVVLYSDHGEEFWEHNGVEHGHALWEEVVRVPLIIRSPAIDRGHVSRPGSLLDLTPTLLAALGIETDIDFDGQDLNGDEPPIPVAIGRVLRGAESWAVVADGAKWITRNGMQQRFDLAADPGETDGRKQVHLATPTPEAAILATALGRPVVPVLHVLGPKSSSKSWRTPKGKVVLTLPGGFVVAWASGSLPAQEPIIDGDSVILGPAAPPFPYISQEFFAVPRGDSLDELTLEVHVGDQSWSSTFAETDVSGADPLVAAGEAGARFEVRWDALPLPPDEVVPGTHPDRAEELRALGYTVD